MGSLVLATLFFLGLHLLVSGTRIRDALVARLGEGLYTGLFSLASFAGISWMVRAYSRAPLEILWNEPVGLRSATLVGSFLAFQLAFIGLTTPSPTAAGGEGRLGSDEAVTGILRITRHPFLWGVTLWAVLHLVHNGDLASLCLFTGFVGLCVAGTHSIDAKRARRHGEAWAAFAGRTSNLPFAAWWTGRSRGGSLWREIGWWRPLVAAGVWGAALVAHPLVVGRSPLPLP